MNGRRLLIAVLGTGLLWLQTATGQVQIIRQPPNSDEEPGRATWSEAYSDPAWARESGQADLSGRITVGFQGGQDKAGNALYNLASDSLVSLVQPMGGTTVLSFDATAVRLQSAVSEEQRYDGSLGFDFERLHIKAYGGFNQTVQEASAISSEDADALIGASISSGLIETLTMSLEYQSEWISRAEVGLETASSRSDELSFKSIGTVGSVGLDLQADLAYEDNSEEQSEILGTAGDLTLTVPVGGQLAVLLDVMPVYNLSATGATELQSTSLESGLEASWRPGDDLNTTLRAARVDAWSSGEGVAYEAYQSSWKGGLDVEYLPRRGFFAGPAYTFTQAIGGNTSHDLLLLLGWRGYERVKELSGRGASSFIRSESGNRVKDTLDWQLSAALMPAESMNLDGRYQGGYTWQADGESWNHDVGMDFSHAPDPGLKYRGAFSLTNTLEDTQASSWEQQYTAALTLKPLINFVQYTLDISETLDVNNDDSGDDILSSSLLTFAFPWGRELRLRLGFEWEWINRISISGDPGNYYHYTGGLSVAGKTTPFSLDADYGIAHGYRGLRHDVSSEIQIPLWDSYALNGNFTLSSYEEELESKLYWVLTVNLIYEF